MHVILFQLIFVLISFQGNEDQTKLQSVFASQLLVESTKTNRVDTFTKSVHVLLQCLTNQSVRLAGSKTTSDDVMKILQKCVSETINWMDNHRWQWDTYEKLENALMVIYSCFYFYVFVTFFLCCNILHKIVPVYLFSYYFYE